jgi:VWFA-related protein
MSQDLMRQRSGRKSFILLSDGVDVRSQNTIGTAIEYAQRADTTIYSILYDAPDTGDGKLPVKIGPALRRGAAPMKRLARETGGRYFLVSGSEPIDAVYAQIEEELRSEYVIGYAQDKAASNQKFRKLKLTTVRKDLVVQTREGYYPK